MEKLSSDENSVVLMLLFATIFLALITLGLILFFYFSRKKVIEKEREKSEMKIEHQKKMLQNSIETQELERKRIAQDLHDAISSKLNLVSLSTNVLLSDKNIDLKQKNTLEQILSTTSTTLESSRQIAHDLLPPILSKFGLKAALEELFDECSRNTNIHIEYEIESLKLSEKNELHLFRICQELINNSIRHGEATRLKVLLINESSKILFCFQDNGKGFNIEDAKLKTGIGLQNIYSRVQILNGKINIKSKINEGCSFSITL